MWPDAELEPTSKQGIANGQDTVWIIAKNAPMRIACVATPFVIERSSITIGLSRAKKRFVRYWAFNISSRTKGGTGVQLRLAAVTRFVAEGEKVALAPLHRDNHNE